MPAYSEWDGPAFYRCKNERDAVFALVRLAKSNKEQAQCRRALAAKYSSLFEGLNLTSLAAYGYSTDASHYFREFNVDVPLIRNTCNSAVETFVSWIGSLDNPKCMFMTTKGKWSDKRKAEKLKRLVQAGYPEKQGRFSNQHQQFQHGLRMAAAATGAVAIKVCAYPNETKTTHELHDTLTMFFDYGELSYGALLTLGEVTWFDPERLMEIYPGNDDLILKNTKEPPREFNVLASQSKVKRLCPLYEGWRASTAGTTGKYVAGLEDGSCMAFDDYDYDSPPFSWYVHHPHLWGPMGHSTTHYIYESCRRDNMIMATVDRSVMKTPKSRTYAVLDQLEVPGSLETVEDNEVIGIKDMAHTPKTETAAGYHPAHLELADRHRSDAYQDSGIPESKAGSKAEPGVDSAIGQRNVAAFLNKRFASQQTRFVHWVAVDTAALDVRALREVYARDPKFSRKWPGKGYLIEVDADVLDLEDSKYVIAGEAVGGITNTPADRAQAALELFQAGAISAESLAIAQQDYDTPDQVMQVSTQREWLKEEMYKWCFASDDEARQPDFYRGPLKYMALGGALLTTIDGLLQAQMDELEPDRQEFFMMFLADLDACIVARAAFMAQMNPQLPGGPVPQASPPQLTA